ncbi:hypothetical protein [Sphingobium yanoikuyae]|nr:hypothetical protein [Sphingobium yanoikuyae]
MNLNILEAAAMELLIAGHDREADLIFAAIEEREAAESADVAARR